MNNTETTTDGVTGSATSWSKLGDTRLPNPQHPRWRTATGCTRKLAMGRNSKRKPRLITFFPEESRLSAKQQDGVRWLNTEVVKTRSRRRLKENQVVVAFSPDDPNTDEGGVRFTAGTDNTACAEDFLADVAALAKLRTRLKKDAPSVVKPYAEKILRLLDDGIANFLARRDGFQLPPFDDLAEAMLLAFAYADVHYVFQRVKSEQCWDELSEGAAGESRILVGLRRSLNEYLSHEDAEGLIKAINTRPKKRPGRKTPPLAPLERLQEPKYLGGPRRATIEALAIWRHLSARTIETRLDLIGTDAVDPIER